LAREKHQALLDLPIKPDITTSTAVGLSGTAGGAPMNLQYLRIGSLANSPSWTISRRLAGTSPESHWARNKLHRLSGTASAEWI